MKPSRRIPTPFKTILTLIPAIFILAVTIIASAAMPIRADNTLRGKRLRVSSTARDAMMGIKTSEVTAPDTLYLPSRDSIQASGYDKPLRTNRETILLTNATSRPLQGLALTISYIDMQGRQLHERTDTLAASIPAGETRMLHLATWDTQHSYYYHRGQKPRTANVTPYGIRCRIDFILLTKSAF